MTVHSPRIQNVKFRAVPFIVNLSWDRKIKQSYQNNWNLYFFYYIMLLQSYPKSCSPSEKVTILLLQKIGASIFRKKTVVGCLWFLMQLPTSTRKNPGFCQCFTFSKWILRAPEPFIPGGKLGFWWCHSSKLFSSPWLLKWPFPAISNQPFRYIANTNKHKSAPGKWKPESKRLKLSFLIYLGAKPTVTAGIHSGDQSSYLNFFPDLTRIKTGM